MIGTLGEAHDLGWKIRVYCRFGKREALKSPITELLRVVR